MNDIPAGLICGKAPLLLAFLERRRAAIARVLHLRSLLTCPGPHAPCLVTEHNEIVDVVMGRRPR